MKEKLDLIKACIVRQFLCLTHNRIGEVSVPHHSPSPIGLNDTTLSSTLSPSTTPSRNAEGKSPERYERESEKGRESSDRGSGSVRSSNSTKTLSDFPYSDINASLFLDLSRLLYALDVYSQLSEYCHRKRENRIAREKERERSLLAWRGDTSSSNGSESVTDEVTVALSYDSLLPWIIDSRTNSNNDRVDWAVRSVEEISLSIAYSMTSMSGSEDGEGESVRVSASIRKCDDSKGEGISGKGSAGVSAYFSRGCSGGGGTGSSSNNRGTDEKERDSKRERDSVSIEELGRGKLIELPASDILSLSLIITLSLAPYNHDLLFSGDAGTRVYYTGKLSDCEEQVLQLAMLACDSHSIQRLLTDRNGTRDSERENDYAQSLSLSLSIPQLICQYRQHFLPNSLIRILCRLLSKVKTIDASDRAAMLTPVLVSILYYLYTMS